MTFLANPDRSAVSMLSGTVLSFASLMSVVGLMAPTVMQMM